MTLCSQKQRSSLAGNDVILIPGLTCDETVWEPQHGALAPVTSLTVFYRGAQLARYHGRCATRVALGGEALSSRLDAELERLR